MNHVKFVDLGLKDYKETWDFQQNIQNKLIRAKTGGEDNGSMPYLIIVEHPHVYTLGKSGKEGNLLINPDFLASLGAVFYKTDRGGDITYHGPGQIVGYPIFDLDTMGIGVKKYIDKLENSIISALSDYSIDTGHLEGATGVWVKAQHEMPSRKICAIGVKVSRGITMHGFALNVSTNLKYFSYINPCGFTDKSVTSMEQELGRTPDLATVKRALYNKIASEFNIDYV